MPRSRARRIDDDPGPRREVRPESNNRLVHGADDRNHVSLVKRELAVLVHVPPVLKRALELLEHRQDAVDGRRVPAKEEERSDVLLAGRFRRPKMKR